MRGIGMQGACSKQQAGVSLFGALFIMIFLALIFVIVAKVVPTFTEFRAVQALVKKDAAASHTVQEGKDYFDRFASVDDVESISGKDLDVQRSSDGVSISFAYEKKIPLAGPVSLAIDYAGKSDRGS
jgi:hypothetical protein